LVGASSSISSILDIYTPDFSARLLTGMSSIHPSPSEIKNTPMKRYIEFEGFKMEN
jgi:hypothetical protein